MILSNMLPQTFELDKDFWHTAHFQYLVPAESCSQMVCSSIYAPTLVCSTYTETEQSLFVGCTCVPLQSSASCELYPTLVTVVRTGLHMVTLNVPQCLTFITEALATEATAPVLGPRIVHLADRLLLNVSQHFVLVHKD